MTHQRLIPFFYGTVLFFFILAFGVRPGGTNMLRLRKKNQQPFLEDKFQVLQLLRIKVYPINHEPNVSTLD